MSDPFATPWTIALQTSFHGISQARILEGFHSLLQGIFQPRDRTRVPCFGRWILHHWATREALLLWLVWCKSYPRWINIIPNKQLYFTRKQKQGSEMFKLDFYVFANSLPKNFKHYSISSHVPFIQLPQMLTLLYYYSMIVQTRNFT